MTDDVFIDLAAALDRLPNGFPQTPSRVEIRILKKIFSPEEAALAGQLTGKYETIKEIATRAGLNEGDINRALLSMAQRGLLWAERQDGRIRFRLAPFVVGIYEAQLHILDHELAHLVEDYFLEGGVKGLMTPQPSLHRVVPAQKAVKTEWILPYDDIRSIILESKTFNVRDCICRVQKDQIGETCRFPVHTCLNFSHTERPPSAGDVSQSEALELLDQCEEIGLVHTVNNVAKGVFYVCNCCGCCCGILRGITEFGIENSVARANYYAIINPEACTGCGTCIERCQVSAISDDNGVSVIDLKRCIGCGLCVTGCPSQAVHLERKPEAETIHPPENFSEWEKMRLQERGWIQ
ncbi:MAG: 4Fe-4S binding protein [Anaerolineaceae bacterium]|nr:4Fe-4S binding protein [Anaerolineaceae bacterium]